MQYGTNPRTFSPPTTFMVDLATHSIPSPHLSQPFSPSEHSRLVLVVVVVVAVVVEDVVVVDVAEVVEVTVVMLVVVIVVTVVVVTVVVVPTS